MACFDHLPHRHHLFSLLYHSHGGSEYARRGWCIVISCCCQCLILQIGQENKGICQEEASKKGEKSSSSSIEEIVRIHEESLRTEGEREFEDIGGHGCGCCLEEVEKVMEELSRRGDFAFGSFWGKRGGAWPWGVPKIVTKDQNGDVK